MTDQNPVPTTRMPVPEPSDAAGDDTQGWPPPPAPNDADRDATHAPPADAAAAAPPAPVEPLQPVPPVPPFEARPRRDERDHGRTASILFGLVVLGLGLWFFAEHTLGYELPRIQWSQVWPITLIAIGLWVVLGSMRRGSR